MKHISFVILILCFSHIEVDGQAKYRKLKIQNPPPGGYSKEILAIERKNHDCVRINVKSFSKRIKNYPFNKSSQIQLISFEGPSLPVLNDSILYSKLKEVKILNLQQIDSLTDILYNVGFGGTILIIQESKCYTPRNAILFIDDSGKMFAYIEICFECEGVVLKPETIPFGDICNQKFSLLKKQFINAGIHYGTKTLY